jgi:hypothetical protein
MIWSHRSRAPAACGRHPQPVGALLGAGGLCARRARRGAPVRTSPSACTACMKASVTPTEMLKLRRSPLSLAWMNSSMSGWSQRSTPICAPRRRRPTPPFRRSGRTPACSSPGRWRCFACCPPRRRAGGCARSRSPRRRRGAWFRRLRSARCRCRGGRRRCCAMESPTGCTKQLISVAARWCRRPTGCARPGTKPPSSASRKRSSQAAALSAPRPAPAHAPRGGARRPRWLVVLGVLLGQHLGADGAGGPSGHARCGSGRRRAGRPRRGRTGPSSRSPRRPRPVVVDAELAPAGQAVAQAALGQAIEGLGAARLGLGTTACSLRLRPSGSCAARAWPRRARAGRPRW